MELLGQELSRPGRFRRRVLESAGGQALRHGDSEYPKGGSQQHRDGDDTSRCGNGQQGDPMQQRLSSCQGNPSVETRMKSASCSIYPAPRGLRVLRCVRWNLVHRRRWSWCRIQLLCCAATSASGTDGKDETWRRHTVAHAWAPVSGPTSWIP